MSGIGAHQNQDRITLRNRLSDVAQLLVWVKDLAWRHSIPQDLQFAIDLCLEEAVSNIIRHGYAEANGFAVTVAFTMPCSGNFEFVIEDEAPAFNLLDAPELPAMNPADDDRSGGHGIRLMRGFASALEYEALPGGNRLRIRFSAQGFPAGSK